MGDGSSDTKHFLKEFYIPDYIIDSSASFEAISYVPEYPVIVFINSRSGGQLGGELLKTYQTLLNSSQVFDLGENSPDKVLHKLYSNIERLKAYGDTVASDIEKRMRIIAAGGDGTAGWILGVVCDLKLTQPPPVATVPLGTGNNLPFSFGWGKRNPGTDRDSVKSFLHQVKNAREMKIDSWHVLMRMKAPEEGACDPIAPVELPHALHAFKRVSHTDPMNEAPQPADAVLSEMEGSSRINFKFDVYQFQNGLLMDGYHTFRGGFWNYFSMGMDAQVSYEFHSERKSHPEHFRNQLANQAMYAKIGCSQGWFCASLLHPSSRNIAQLAKVKIMKKHGRWQDLNIPRSIRSIICLNLPSFSGGLNPWGTPNSTKKRDRDLTAPFVDDGLLEVVGFRDAWHGLVLLSSKGHGTRLAQAHRVRFEFHKAAADYTYMRMDGEPWKQPLPKEDDTVVVEISHLGQVNMLATHDCIAKSAQDPTSPSHAHEEDDDGDSMESGEEAEGRRKFGAADTFRLSLDDDAPIHQASGSANF